MIEIYALDPIDEPCQACGNNDGTTAKRVEDHTSFGEGALVYGVFCNDCDKELHTILETTPARFPNGADDFIRYKKQFSAAFWVRQKKFLEREIAEGGVETEAEWDERMRRHHTPICKRLDCAECLRWFRKHFVSTEVVDVNFERVVIPHPEDGRPVAKLDLPPMSFTQRGHGWEEEFERERKD